MLALTDLAEEAGVSLVHLALAFVLEHPAVTSAIIGPRTFEHLEAALDADKVSLGHDVLDRIDEIVPPGTTLNDADAGYVPPAVADASLRRRTPVVPLAGRRPVRSGSAAVRSVLALPPPPAPPDQLAQHVEEHQAAGEQHGRRSAAAPARVLDREPHDGEHRGVLGEARPDVGQRLGRGVDRQPRRRP